MASVSFIGTSFDCREIAFGEGILRLNTKYINSLSLLGRKNVIDRIAPWRLICYLKNVVPT
jgi:hypothetical protein